eukprot:546582-Rhodomonas_salina.1
MEFGGGAGRGPEREGARGVDGGGGGAAQGYGADDVARVKLLSDVPREWSEISRSLSDSSRSYSTTEATSLGFVLIPIDSVAVLKYRS